MINQSANAIKYSERFKAVLAYRQKKLSVIPVGDNKNPFIAWKEFQARRATEDELLAWWTKWPGANIGIVTGKISNLSVLDCDNEAAVALIEEWLPDSFLCPIVGTPRGGRHYWFAYDETIKTTTGILPGIDIRNDGGYVIAPPSLTPRGVYKWICLGE